jgi:hypothetical protein
VILESQTNGQLLVILDILKANLKARVERKRLNESEANSVVVGKEKNAAMKDLLKSDVFDRDFKKFDIFNGRILNMFKLAHYEDLKKFIIMRSYLSGYAFEWTEDYEVQIEGEIEFEKYLTEFEKNFGQPLKEEYAVARVREFCMRNDLPGYIREFRPHIRDISAGEALKKSWFINGLPKWLRKNLNCIGNIKLSELIAKTIKLHAENKIRYGLSKLNYGVTTNWRERSETKNVKIVNNLGKNQSDRDSREYIENHSTQPKVCSFCHLPRH